MMKIGQYAVIKQMGYEIVEITGLTNKQINWYRYYTRRTDKTRVVKTFDTEPEAKRLVKKLEKIAADERLQVAAVKKATQERIAQLTA